MSKLPTLPALKEREPKTVFCEGSGFDRDNTYDVGVVLSTSGKALKKARLPSVPFVFVEKEEPAATAPSVTGAQITTDWSRVIIKFSAVVSGPGKIFSVLVIYNRAVNLIPWLRDPSYYIATYDLTFA